MQERNYRCKKTAKIARGLQESFGSLEELMACVWTINAIRRALARLSQTWVNRLQHPEAAAASIQLSRANSLEEILSQNEAISNKMQGKLAGGIDAPDSLELKAEGLKLLVGSILAGTDDSRSPLAPSSTEMAAPEVETLSEPADATAVGASPPLPSRRTKGLALVSTVQLKVQHATTKLDLMKVEDLSSMPIGFLYIAISIEVS